MADFALPSVSPNLLAPVDQTTAADLAKRANIKKTAQDFEQSFLSIMLGQMFTGTDAASPFGGGHGEKMFKSFLTDAIAKQMARSGGVGLADTVAKEMLKLQGLTEAPAATQGA